MIKRLLILFCILFAPAARSAEMVSVEYIHNAIEQRCGIVVPYNPALGNKKVAANMKYLLTAIDRANEIQNNRAVSHYGDNSTFATMAAADTVATNDAIDRLIKMPFTITTTPDTTVFNFDLSARGTFAVNWGDGTFQTIQRDNTELQTYSHTYAKAGKYKIGIAGTATGYSIADDTPNTTAAIHFRKNENIAEIHGSVGAIFGTIGDGTIAGNQPNFRNTFRECPNLTSEIPAELFDGVHGAPVPWMFAGTFEATPFSGSIPENLFSGIQGSPIFAMFNNTFKESKISGTIPAKLFSGIHGAPAPYMFAGTFYWVENLTGSIPAGMFAGIRGEPAIYMYHGLFVNCSGLTGQIPENLFGDISGPAAEFMFRYTFQNCSGLTGPSARINGKYLYEIWPDAPANATQLCYKSVTGLSDYATIPAAWK